MTFAAEAGTAASAVAASLIVSLPGSLTSPLNVAGASAPQRDLNGGQDRRHGEQQYACDQRDRTAAARHRDRTGLRLSQRLIQVQVPGEASDQSVEPADHDLAARHIRDALDREAPV